MGPSQAVTSAVKHRDREREGATQTGLQHLLAHATFKIGSEPGRGICGLIFWATASTGKQECWDLGRGMVPGWSRLLSSLAHIRVRWEWASKAMPTAQAGKSKDLMQVMSGLTAGPSSRDKI